jgi:hypothetical protein
MTEENKGEIKFNVSKLGKNGKEVFENISFIIIIASGAMFSIGIALNNFVPGTILLSILGSFFIMVGIIFYIMSQFIEV